MATPLDERRIDLDGEACAFWEFVQRYGERRAVLIERWASSRPVDPFMFDERAVASQLFYAFGAESLRRALSGCWCRGRSQPERVAIEVLRLHPSLATELEEPLRVGGLRPRGCRQVEPVPERVIREGLRLQPGLAASLRGGLLDGMRLPERVALELLRLDPSLASAMLQQRLRAGAALPERLALEVLRLEPGLASSAFHDWVQEGRALPESVALEVLRLDPSLAIAILRRLRAGEELPERVVLEAVRLEPDLASSLCGWLWKGSWLPESVALKLLRLDPSLASAILQRLRAGEELSERLVLEVLRLEPGLAASAFRGWLQEGRALPESVALELLRLGPSLASVLRQLLYTGKDLPKRVLLEVLRLRPDLASDFYRWLQEGRELPETAVAAWHRAQVARRHFLARGLRQVLPLSAAHAIALLLCRSMGCQCGACRARKQAAAVPDASALCAADAGSIGAPNAVEDVPSEQVQEVLHVEEPVEHSEPAAVIHPEEATHITDEEWATEVERRIGALPRTGPGAGGARVAASSGGWRIVLLEFGRRPKELYKAIQESDLAVWLTAQGEDVQPRWASGRFVLVEGAEEGDFFSEAGRDWHVAVSEAYEEAVYNALKSLGHSVKPRLKPNGRRYPDSLMTVSEIGETGDGVSVDWNESAESEGGDSSSEGSRADVVEGEEEADGDGARWTIPVFRTFIHFREPPAWASDRAQSAPARF